MTKGKRGNQAKTPQPPPQQQRKGSKRRTRNRAQARSSGPAETQLALARRVQALPAQSPVQAQAKLLAMSISLPGEVESLRMPTVDMPRSSLASLKDVISISTPHSASSALGWAVGDTLLGLYGQPGRALMFWAETTSSGATYNIAFGDHGLICRVVTNPSGLASGRIDENVPWRPTTATASYGTGPHGPTMGIGHSSTTNQYYVFLDKDDTVTIGGGYWSDGGSNSTMTGSAAWDFYKWTGPDAAAIASGSVLQGLTAGVGVDVTYTAPSVGYYTVVFRGVPSVTSGNLLYNSGPPSITITTNLHSNRWHMRMLSDVDPNNGGDINLASRARVNACSLLVTNTSALTHRQGNILAARIRSLDLTQLSAVSFARMAEKYENDAALGCYTFKSFTEEASAFRDHHVVTSGVPASTGLMYDLDYNDFIHVMRISSDTTTRNNFAVTLNATLEFQTDIPRYMKDVSDYDYPALVMARKIINSEVTWFYENPRHMSDIYGFMTRAIRSLGRVAQSAAPYAAAVGSVAHPANAGAYQALAQALQRMRF